MSERPSLWPQARAHFRRLCDLDPTARDAALAALRADDPTLADDVAGLLAADAEATGSADADLRGAVADLRAAFEDDTMPAEERAGPWRLEEIIGRGGMGEVWRARRQVEDFEQVGALKLLKRGMDSDSLLARFRQERRILARLEHSNIARLLDGGITASGRPYLVMELVEGQPITAYVASHQLDLPGILRLFLRICAGVDVAHRNLVVHRDLKPSNIMVDALGEPKLLDFGIAKLLAGDADDLTVTATAMRALTPAYASPEQLAGEPVTTATDVHALGLILHELTTGTLPRERGERGPRHLHDDVTTRPSQVLRRRLGEDATDEHTRRLARQVGGDLDAIVLTALRGDPARRYPSVAAMAADIGRLLDGRPVSARGDSAAYRMRRFVRRHRVGVTAGALVLVAVAAGLTTSIWQARLARQQAQRAEAVQAFLLDIFHTNSSNQPDPVKARETTARELLDLGADRLGTTLDHAPTAKHTMLSLLGKLYLDLGMDDQAVALQRQAVDLARSLHGPHSLAVVQALVDLAGSLHASAEVNERGAVLEEAEAIVGRHRDVPQDLVARLFTRLAEHHTSLDVTLAVGYAGRAVALLESLPASVALAEAWYSNGVALYFAGDNQAAAQAFARAVEVSEQVQGFPNPSMPRFYALLSNAQYNLLEIEEARASARKSLEAALQVSGPEHIDTIQTTMRLGRLLMDTGATREGLHHLAQARELVLATRGADDPFHAPQALLEHGTALVRAGDPQAGLADIQDAIANRRLNRPGTLYLAQMLESAALALIQLDRGTETDALLAEAEQIRDAANQPRGTASWNQHVALRARRAAATQQPDQVQHWLGSYAVPADGGSREQIELLTLRAELMLDLGAPAEAASAASQALATLQELGLQDDLALLRIRILHAHGRAALSSGDADAGCASLREALTLAQEHLLPISRQLTGIRATLAACR